MTADVNLNALWSRLIAEELQRAGVRTAVLCPGSRNSPLLFALARELGDHVISHTDERSAGFIALGVAKAGGGPAAVCVTSGSALANLMPAIVEAHAAALPLVVIAADRPWEMHGNGSSQAMPQRGIFAQFLACELDLGEPTATPAALRALRAQLSRIGQVRSGPVMINVPLRDPLPPLPDPAWVMPELPDEVRHGRAQGGPFTAMITRDAALKACLWLRPGMAGVIVAGAGDDHFMRAHGLAIATGFPLIADAGSGLRVGEVIACADALIGGGLGESRPDLVIQVGAAPLARVVYEWLGRQDCPWIAIENGRNQDMLGRAWIALERPPEATWQVLQDLLGRGDEVWSARWRRAETAARARLAQVMADEPWGEVLAAHLVCSHPGFAFRHVASSMAVRHANVHVMPGNTVFANRGVSGIDGTIGTFIGIALAQVSAARTAGAAVPHGMLIIGDLAFLHDLPALSSAKIRGLRGAIVVLNNDGGGIFDYLAVAKIQEYRQWVRTPHGADVAGAAAQAGLAYVAVNDRDALSQALAAAAVSDAVTIIECRVAATDTVGRHRALLKAMADAGNFPGKNAEKT
jgi:2-succinyl-5-enolpyruvyl-6-hydroxy-3-cyclohexene-1-carboxylate synthase